MEAMEAAGFEDGLGKPVGDMQFVSSGAGCLHTAVCMLRPEWAHTL